jgi:hypothetical protein
MKGNTAAEVLKKRHEKITKLMAQTIVSNDTAFDAIDEAAVHLIHHFDPPERDEHIRDHVLLIGQAYFGRSVDDPEKCISATELFIHGDAHQLSHTIADIMRDDAAMFTIIMHAVEVYNRLPKPGQQN